METNLMNKGLSEELICRLSCLDSGEMVVSDVDSSRVMFSNSMIGDNHKKGKKKKLPSTT
jgi:hypothetical protein